MQEKANSKIGLPLAAGKKRMNQANPQTVFMCVVFSLIVGQGCARKPVQEAPRPGAMTPARIAQRPKTKQIAPPSTIMAGREKNVSFIALKGGIRVLGSSGFLDEIATMDAHSAKIATKDFKTFTIRDDAGKELKIVDSASNVLAIVNAQPNGLIVTSGETASVAPQTFILINNAKKPVVIKQTGAVIVQRTMKSAQFPTAFLVHGSKWSDYVRGSFTAPLVGNP